MTEEKQQHKEYRDHPKQRMLVLNADQKEAFLGELADRMERSGLELDRHVVLRIDPMPDNSEKAFFIKLTLTAQAMQARYYADVGDIYDLIDDFSGPARAR